MTYEQLPSRIKLVFNECASHWAVRPSELIGTGKRKTTITAARAETSRRLRLMGKSYPEIGRYMGLHHSSVMYQLNGKKASKPLEKPLEPIQGPWFVPDYSGEWI